MLRYDAIKKRCNAIQYFTVWCYMIRYDAICKMRHEAVQCVSLRCGTNEKYLRCFIAVTFIQERKKYRNNKSRNSYKIQQINREISEEIKSIKQSIVPFHSFTNFIRNCPLYFGTTGKSSLFVHNSSKMFH